MLRAYLASRRALMGAILLAVLARLAAQVAMPTPLASDAKSYFFMAESLAHGHTMRDYFTQIAFYSPGYPILLAPLFAVFGSVIAVGLWLNLALAAWSAWLVYCLAFRLSASPVAAVLIASGYALWIPSVFEATMLAKENLSVPLLAAFVLVLLQLKDSAKPARAAALAGGLYAANILTGASALLIILAFALVLFERHGWRQVKAPMREAMAFALGAALLLAPWLVHTHAQLGKPVLTTNSGFNLYLGNNPAATGHFISIKNTPAASSWEAMRLDLGEIGSAEALGDQAKIYMIAKPGQTIIMAFKKLGLFWSPNVPDAADFKADAKVARARWIDVAQHVLILIAGLWGAIAFARRSAEARIIIAVILGFWAVHAATYNIVRYRVPVMPLMLVLASLPLGGLLTRKEVRGVKA